MNDDACTEPDGKATPNAIAEAAAKVHAILEALVHARRSLKKEFEGSTPRTAPEVTAYGDAIRWLNAAIHSAYDFHRDASERSVVWEVAFSTIPPTPPAQPIAMSELPRALEVANEELDAILGSGVLPDWQSIATIDGWKANNRRAAAETRNILKCQGWIEPRSLNAPEARLERVDLTDVVEIEARMSGVLSTLRQLQQAVEVLQKRFVTIVIRSSQRGCDQASHRD